MIMLMIINNKENNKNSDNNKGSDINNNNDKEWEREKDSEKHNHLYFLHCFRISNLYYLAFFIHYHCSSSNSSKIYCQQNTAMEQYQKNTCWYQ